MGIDAMILLFIWSIVPAAVVHHDMNDELEANKFILQEQINFQEWNTTVELCRLRYRKQAYTKKIEECELRAYAKWCSVTKTKGACKK